MNNAPNDGAELSKIISKSPPNSHTQRDRPIRQWELDLKERRSLEKNTNQKQAKTIRIKNRLLVWFRFERLAIVLGCIASAIYIISEIPKDTKQSISNLFDILFL